MQCNQYIGVTDQANQSKRSYQYDLFTFIVDLELEKKVFISSCSKCHPLISPNEYKINQWEPIVRRYRDKNNLNKAEEKAIIDYLKAYNNSEK